jgi:hypothetical protein
MDEDRGVCVRFSVALRSQRIPAGITLAIGIETADDLIEQARTVRCRQLQHLPRKEFEGYRHGVIPMAWKRSLPQRGTRLSGG